jgi:hypothetical protein
MTIEQLAKDLLAIIDSEMYVNDFGGLQAGRDATTDIHAAMGKLQASLAEQEQEPVESCNGMPAYEGPLSKTQRKQLTQELNAPLTLNGVALYPQPEQEPAQEPVGVEWTPCIKRPHVVVHVRQQRRDETHVSTREGITPAKPDDLIMRGVEGEEYPIGRVLFLKTYTFDISPPKRELESTTDMMMELADRLGELPDDIDPRAWSHLLVYASQRQPLTDEQLPPIPSAYRGGWYVGYSQSDFKDYARAIETARGIVNQEPGLGQDHA